MAGKNFVSFGDSETIISKMASTRPATFTGTKAEWDALTVQDKKEFEIVNLTDDTAGGGMVVTDEVTEGNMNPVTSNAVAETMKVKNIPITTASAYTSGNIIVTKAGHIVQVTTQAVAATIGSADTIIARGLPKAVSGIYQQSFNAGGGELRFVVSTAGELLISGSNAVNAWCGFTYITNE